MNYSGVQSDAAGFAGGDNSTARGSERVRTATPSPLYVTPTRSLYCFGLTRLNAAVVSIGSALSALLPRT